jgi:hypothetical protein
MDSLKKGPMPIDAARCEAMKHQTLAPAADQSVGFERYRKPARRDEFLATMNAIVPWSQSCEVIRSHYIKGVGGRPPIGLERMLRIHFIQRWFNLTDEACEEALYDSAGPRTPRAFTALAQPDIYVTLNQICAGIMPFMGIQVLALALLYIWLPNLLHK